VILVLHNTKNTGIRRDAVGAFIPEARAFEAFYAPQGPTRRIGFDNLAPTATRAREVEHAIQGSSAVHQVRLIAILCHGWRTRLDTGHGLGMVSRLALAIRSVSVDDVRVSLMACSTGASPTKRTDEQGEGSFAARLRDELAALGHRGGWVDAHSTAGHTTRNPWARRFVVAPKLEGGEWIVEPRTSLWAKWRDALRGPLRFAYANQTLEQIRSAL
jgi:hypothetical protein